MSMPYFIHGIAIGMPVFLSALGVAIGQGIIGGDSTDSMTRQPLGNDSSLNAMIVGLAVTETGGIFGLVISILLIFMPADSIVTLGSALAELGIGCAIGIPAAIVGIAVGMALRATLASIARQPLISVKIMTLMFIVLSFIEAPVILGFIVALLIKSSMMPALTLVHGIKLLCGGLVFGLGSIGPIIGQALLSHSALTGIGMNNMVYGRMFTYMLLCAAIIETPVILSLVLSFLFIYAPMMALSGMLSAIAIIAAVSAMGIGSLGAGIANGIVSASGCRQIAANGAQYPQILRITMITVALIESSAIYAFIIALLLFTRAL